MIKDNKIITEDNLPLINIIMHKMDYNRKDLR